MLADGGKIHNAVLQVLVQLMVGCFYQMNFHLWILLLKCGNEPWHQSMASGE